MCEKGKTKKGQSEKVRGGLWRGSDDLEEVCFKFWRGRKNEPGAATEEAVGIGRSIVLRQTARNHTVGSKQQQQQTVAEQQNDGGGGVTSAPCVTVLLLIWGPVAVPNNNLLPCARHPVLMSPESSSNLGSVADPTWR